jgi:hypothetical protein
MTTWNSADKSSTVFLSSDALTASSTGTSAGAVRSTDAVNTGKLYLEFQGVGEAVGLTTASAALGTIGPSALGALIYQATGNISVNGSATGVSLGVIGSETIGIAVDFATSRLWVRLNAGLWNNSGSDNPATGTGGLDVSALFPGNAAYAVATFTTAERSATVNFGANTFAYAAPSGFTGWYAPPADGSADAGLTQTLAALTLSGFGVSGTLSTTQARLTQVALEHWISPLAEARLTQVALELWGSVATTTVGTGLVTATFAPATLTATGVLSTPTGPNTGRLAPFTFQSATLSATGTLVNHGALDQTLGTLVLNPPALGVEKYGSLDATLAPLTLAGVGTKVSGRLDAILGALTLSGTGAVAKRGKLERTLGALSLNGQGALANRGTLSATLGPVRMLALGGLAGVAPGTPGVVSQQMFFFAWTDEASEFDSSMLREDESIYSFELIHEESDFPSLRLDLKNPKVGLLAAGRNVWCWFSWRNPESGEIIPLFHGRLIGIPEDLHDEVVRLQFVARPSNYIEWKNIVAAGLKVRPFWDPVWIAEGDTDPDTALEARPSAWHIDRVSLAVTASDTIIGEDGTLAITADDHFYDSLKVSYGDTPLRRVDVTGTVTWTQQGSDFVDITQQLYDQFRFAGSPYEFPMVSSFTGDGLLGSWPEPGASIGGGWSMDATSGVAPATWQQAWLKSIVYVAPVLNTAQEILTPGYYQWGGGWAGAGIMGWKPAVTRDREYVAAHETIATVFPLIPIANTFRVRWEASRGRTEHVRFAMTADTQPLLVDPGDDETDKLDLSSDFVAQPVDAGGALPIGSLLRNSYFNTDRGNQSVEYLIMLARAKMLSRARAVSLSVETPFGFATRLSCRMNATVEDSRLPGGQGTGKVTRYALSVDGDSGEAKAEITLGCTVGKGNTVTPDPGEPTYSDGYNTGYEAVDGATLDAGTGDILYESFDGLDVVDDDGIDLFRMTPDRIIQSLTVTNGPDYQQNTLDSFYRAYTPPGIEQKPPEMGTPVGTYVAPETPTEMLSKMPTTVELNLMPISRQSFETTWEPSVSALMVPKTIDLEAPYP